jgi:hypothetical protein
MRRMLEVSPESVRRRRGPGTWTFCGRGWSLRVELRGISVPHDPERGPDPEGLQARTLAKMLAGLDGGGSESDAQ